ncbi:MAG: response regulator transcription factor [Saprospiraceae bacterium]|nr:response regulator transcription factor [Saprospiraceae bacterium]MBK7810824.1 response regulator transcription factor [Saprospiraceae bacterium]MBK9630419.1 response regulator transcription factor [Saprospiraceae bacterium]
MRKLNILIVEDEILIAELISEYLIETGHEVLGIALSYEEALQQINLRKPDLILVDIRLYGENSGIDLVNHLNGQQESIPIIYLSSQYDQRTLQLALNTNPYGYLTKPIRKETLWTSIEAAYQLYLSKNPINTYIDIFDGKTHHHLNIQNILYIEADHVYVNIYLTEGQALNIRKTLKQLIEILDVKIMVQCHRSYLVNRNYIKSWNSDSLKLINDQVLPISRNRRKDLE